jgi:hypothetical protein
MAGLFISYRRDDSQGSAGRMAGDLSRILGEDRVFSDIEIPAGSNFGARARCLGGAVAAGLATAAGLPAAAMSTTDPHQPIFCGSQVAIAG